MEQQFTAEYILTLANQCISLSHKERPELLWLKERYRIFQTVHHQKSRAAADSLLYEYIYGQPPAKASDVLKIRYWRTGQHVPFTRKDCLAFGHALGLSDAELNYLIQAYFNLCITDDLRKLSGDMNQMAEQYLSSIPYEKLCYFRVTPDTLKHNLRHLYFTDAISYIHSPVNFAKPYPLKKHITSTHYDSEFLRLMQLRGKIPRATLIRHFIILGLPSIRLDKLNRLLDRFGYVPLSDDHTLIGGERADWLIIRLLLLYEELCHISGEAYAHKWFRESCRILDLYFAQSGYGKLRFMHFRALDM